MLIRLLLAGLFCINLNADEFLSEPYPIALAVIGSGPAGVSAAFTASKERIPTILFQGPRLGGPLNGETHIGNWPGADDAWGKDVMSAWIAQGEDADVMIENQSILSVDFSCWPFLLKSNDGRLFSALSVIVAAGAQPKTLEVPGEIQYWGKGITTDFYKKDAGGFKGKRVAVVGGGLDAVSKASAIASKADQVYLIVRKSTLQKERWVKRLASKGFTNLSILYNSNVQGYVGADDLLTGIKVVCEGKEQIIPVDHVVLALGLKPRSEIFQSFVTCDNQGFITLTGRSQETSIKGVFAAGNITDNRYRQALTAMGDGMKAGYDAVDFLRSLGFNDARLKTMNFYKPVPNVAQKFDLNRVWYKNLDIANGN